MDITKLNLTFLLLVIYLTNFGIQGTLIGIDYGNDNTKVALIRPGRGIEIILNSQSQRKTPTAISFSSSSSHTLRIFGDDALSNMIRNPLNTILHLPSFVGLCTIKEERAKMKFGLESEALLPNGLPIDLFPYKLQDDNTHNSIMLNIDGHGMSIEELNAHFLDYIRRMSENAAQNINSKKSNLNPGPIYGSDSVGAVIAIPPTYTQRQRQSLVDSCEISGMNLFGLVNSLGAAAIQQSIDLKYDDPVTFLYYDMGANDISACVVEFKPANVTYIGRNLQSHYISVLGCHMESNVGSYLADIAIVRIMMKRIKEGSTKNISGIPLDNNRVLQKLAKQSTRTKLLLSTLKQTEFFVESLYNDLDFTQTITREEFNKEIQEPILSKILTPIYKALNVANKTMNDINDIEVVGGGIRIPKVRHLLESHFEEYGKTLNQRLNGDEAMAMGAAFVAANYSATFRTKTIYYTEYSFNNYTLCIGSNVIPFLNSSTPLHGMHNIDILLDRDISISLKENSQDIISYNITGIEELVRSGMVNTPNVNITLSFKVNTFGIISLENVFAWYMVNKTMSNSYAAMNQNQDVILNNTNNEGNQNSTKNEVNHVNNSDTTNDAQSEVSSPVINVLVPKSISLNFTEKVLSCPIPISLPTKQSISHHINELNKHDAKHQLLMDSKNNLEGLIYDIRNRLYEDIYITVTTEAEREYIQTDLSSIEDWLYEIGDAISLSSIDDHIEAIKNKTKDIILRAEEYKYRPELLNIVNMQFNSSLQTLSAIQITHTWIQNTTIHEVRESIYEFKKWFDELVMEQEKLKSTDMPVLLRSIVLSKLDNIVKDVLQLKSTPKPKPKSKPKLKYKDENKNSDTSQATFNETNSNRTILTNETYNVEDIAKDQHIFNATSKSEETLEQNNTRDKSEL
ncbi:DnaK family protein [Cryptosporidium muris RN66]|uniref:DnaK family protein n=1 Tax=Cryptosporidium muris (strain RN66) TaxID=441375 RepID=B6AJW6_CRYMR|nr:DnaK family protein [Cryptosporidium muris RN66]EEA08507.1 DnaK family protein [Cryptosporidium muris RN66]|eukprot:XP_002142856.1 DnaK family protein [Cryptosporidium muris RN66]